MLKHVFMSNIMSDCVKMSHNDVYISRDRGYIKFNKGVPKSQVLRC